MNANNRRRSSRNRVDRLREREQVSLTMDPLLTPKAVAKFLSVHPRTLSRLAHSSEFPQPIRIGRSLRWRADQISAWLGAQS